MHKTCKAHTWFADGNDARCGQLLTGQPTKSGHALCCYHDKVATGLTTPTQSNFPDEHVIAVTLDPTNKVLFTDNTKEVDGSEEVTLLVA